MKIANNNFLTLVERAMSDPGRSHMRPVIEKELLHYDILFALDSENLLDTLTFQGGTSLRLCYGAPRFSEDLDFVGGYDFKSQNLFSMKDCLEKYLNKRYGLEVTVKEPKDFEQESEDKNVNVSKWQLRIETHPGQKDLPKQLIKIEVANIPAYTREPKQLLHNYNFLPDGYNDTIVMVETLDEILADKIVAFINCTYVRYRDIWDIYWLKQQGAIVKMDLIHRKLKDYKVTNFVEKLDNMLGRLFNIINREKDFKQQMSRFLPMNLQERTLLNEKYIFLLTQENMNVYKNLGFEWEMKKNGEIVCTNSLRELDQHTMEQTIILMQSSIDKNGFYPASYGKVPQELIVSKGLEDTAKNLIPIHKISWPIKYRVDRSLQPGQWFLTFVAK